MCARRPGCAPLVSMSVRPMSILKSIGRSDAREPGRERGAGLAPDSAARSRAEEAVGADLTDLGDDRALFAAVVDVLLEALECFHLREWASSVLAVVRGEMDEAHAILEPERRIPEPGWLRLV